MLLHIQSIPPKTDQNNHMQCLYLLSFTGSNLVDKNWTIIRENKKSLIIQSCFIQIHNTWTWLSHEILSPVFFSPNISQAYNNFHGAHLENHQLNLRHAMSCLFNTSPLWTHLTFAPTALWNSQCSLSSNLFWP